MKIIKVSFGCGKMEIKKKQFFHYDSIRTGYRARYKQFVEACSIDLLRVHSSSALILDHQKVLER